MNFKMISLAPMLLALAGGVQADLVDRGNGLIYDTTRNITWLADMNYAKTSGYADMYGVPPGTSGSALVWTDGRMGREAANAWIAHLNAEGLLGVTSWRLPTVNVKDTTCSGDFFANGDPAMHFYFGYGCTGGELTHLFVSDFGNKPGESVLNPDGDTLRQKGNLALFRNVQSASYWSGTEYVEGSGVSWGFGSYDGSQSTFGKAGGTYVTAVFDGDVTAPVPEPETYALMLLGLGAVGLAARRRKA